METLSWIAGAVASALLGGLAMKTLILRRPPWRIAALLALNVSAMILIAFLDVEPPNEATTWRSDGSALTPWSALLAWLLQAGLFGAVFGAIATRAPDPSPAPLDPRSEP